MKFAQKGNVRSPDGMAALALLRAITQHLIKDGKLIAKDVEAIRAAALAEIGNENNDGIQEAKRLVASQFP